MTFNTSRTASNGRDYSRTNGNSRYVQYWLLDDPVRVAQMKTCTLKTTCYGKAKQTRMINSYYAHTWKSISIKSVTLSASTDMTAELAIEMSLKTNNWKVYSYATLTK